MVLWCSVFIAITTLRTCYGEPAAPGKRLPDKVVDTDDSGTDFVPQYSAYHGFPQFAQPVFSAPQDLTALQQTHVLGAFQHRFQPPRFGPPPPHPPPPHQFNNGPPQPPQQVLFTQQTDFSQRPNNFQEPQGPPQHHQIVPQQPPQHIAPPQQQNVVPQQQQIYRTLPVQKPENPPFLQQPNEQQQQRGPPNVRFPQQQPNFQNNQQGPFPRPPPTFINPPQPQKIPQFNNHLPQQPRFVQPHQFVQRPPQQVSIAQPPVSLGQPPVSLAQPPTNNNNNPFAFRQPPQQPPQPQFIQEQQNVQQNIQQNVQQTIQHNLQQQNLQPNPPPEFQQNFNKNEQFARPPQINFNQRRPPFNPTPFPQPNQDLTTQYQVNIVHKPPTPPTNNEIPVERPTFIQPKPQIPFEFRPTEPPKFVSNGITEAFTTRYQPEQSRITPSSTPLQNNDNSKEIIFQKSQEQTYFDGDYFDKQNEVSPSPRPTTADPFTPYKIRKTTKPPVQEITINLNDKGVPDEIPPQLYIKENRQKQLQELKKAHEQKEKPAKKAKKEKTQEEIINEQIQKLLQSHNLEIINKETLPGGDSLDDEEQTEQTKNKFNYNIQLVNTDDVLNDKKKKEAPTTPEGLPPLPDLPDHIKKQYDIKLVQRDELFKQFSIGTGGKVVANEDLIAPGPGSQKFGNNTVFLANGQQLEVVKFGKDGTMKKVAVGTTTTQKPPKVLFEELAKGVIPHGADFELIKHKGNGEVEKVSDIDSAKKVTFVLLEEQPDGTVKVQGVKGNGNTESNENESVDSLIKKIKDGSLKLPPIEKSKANSILTNEIPRSNPATHKTFVTVPPTTEKEFHYSPSPSSPSPYYTEKETEGFPTDIVTTTETTYPGPFSLDNENTFAPTPSTDPPTPFVPTSPSFVRSSSKRSKSKSRVTFLPTLPSVESTVSTTTFPSQRIKSTSVPYLITTQGRKTPKKIFDKNNSKYDDPDYTSSEEQNQRSSFYNGEGSIPQDVIAEESNIETSKTLNEILRDEGLTEMAKFLDQSGLDTILNETGPYTIFIPTDKAFRSLELQLGGSDKAEDKFKENPRLLSGLLLHHVVPGSFRVEDLQDEMTGVSLAGTQLRVNTYPSQDKRFKDERIVTINGAKISSDRRDITVPQGLAHAVDRVLFPLPVGDILQTLKGDRERRFTKFVKSLEASGLSDMLTGTKTYTVFAPTDTAFSALTDAELDKLLTRREAARTIVLRHIMPGTLYSAGMQYYQVKESMERGQKITLQKELGKVKANSAQVVSPNVPATNGVIHVVDALL